MVVGTLGTPKVFLEETVPNVDTRILVVTPLLLVIAVVEFILTIIPTNVCNAANIITVLGKNSQTLTSGTLKTVTIVLDLRAMTLKNFNS